MRIEGVWPKHPKIVPIWGRGRNGVFDPRLFAVWDAGDDTVILGVGSRRLPKVHDFTPIELSLSRAEMRQLAEAIIKVCDGEKKEE